MKMKNINLKDNISDYPDNNSASII